MQNTLTDWLDAARAAAPDVSVAAATARFAAFGGDPNAVPAGPYCYSERLLVGTNAGGLPITRTVPCPFWAANPDAPEQAYGYCAKLAVGDWEEDGTLLLWDRCKECGDNLDVGNDVDGTVEDGVLDGLAEGAAPHAAP